MDEVLAADGAELALGEEAGHGDVPRLGADGPGVVVRLVEEARAAAVAGEEQGAGRPVLVGAEVELEQGVQVFVGSLGVADVELHRLADPDPVGEGQVTALPVEAEDVAYQEIAALDVSPVLVDHPADVQTLLKQFLIARAQLLPEIL